MTNSENKTKCRWRDSGVQESLCCCLILCLYRKFSNPKFVVCLRLVASLVSFIWWSIDLLEFIRLLTGLIFTSSSSSNYMLNLYDHIMFKSETKLLFPWTGFSSTNHFGHEKLIEDIWLFAIWDGKIVWELIILRVIINFHCVLIMLFGFGLLHQWYSSLNIYTYKLYELYILFAHTNCRFLHNIHYIWIRFQTWDAQMHWQMTLKRSRFPVCLWGMSRLRSAFMILTWVELAHVYDHVISLNKGDTFESINNFF